jgi:hypothetical protein
MGSAAAFPAGSRATARAASATAVDATTAQNRRVQRHLGCGLGGRRALAGREEESPTKHLRGAGDRSKLPT